MAAHSMAALVSSELANIAGHSSSAPTSSQSPLSRTGSTLTLSQSPAGSSPPGFSYSGRLGDSSGVSGAGSSGFNGHRGGFWSPRRGHGGRQKEGGVCEPRAGLGGLLGGLFKGADTGEAARQQYASQVAQVSALEGEMQALSDDELRVRTAELQKRSRSGESLDSLLPVRILLPFSTSSQIIAIHESASF
jgi:hypothetical protein